MSNDHDGCLFVTAMLCLVLIIVLVAVSAITYNNSHTPVCKEGYAYSHELRLCVQGYKP